MADDALTAQEVAALDRLRIAASAGFGPLFELRPRSEPAGGSFLLIGSDLGASIVLDQVDRTIRALEPGSHQPRFVNTSLSAFAAALIETQAFWTGHREDEEAAYSAAARELRSRLETIDPPSLESPESWWSLVIEQLEQGLL